MTQVQWLLLPLFIHIALLNFVGIKTAIARTAAARAGKVRVKEIATNSSAWPDEVRKIGNNFDNQFEVPTFWYAICALLAATDKIDWVEIILSWSFVFARIIHSYIHIGGNYVPHRRNAFLASVALLTMMWAWFGLRLYFFG